MSLSSLRIWIGYNILYNSTERRCKFLLALHKFVTLQICYYFHFIPIVHVLLQLLTTKYLYLIIAYCLFWEISKLRISSSSQKIALRYILYCDTNIVIPIVSWRNCIVAALVPLDVSIVCQNEMLPLSLYHIYSAGFFPYRVTARM